MKGFNLSEWALKHRSITIYLMIVAVMAGLASYYWLGRAKIRRFIIKTMVVQARLARRISRGDAQAGDGEAGAHASGNAQSRFRCAALRRLA